jgi:gluconate 5-dehydrogenase
MGVFDRFRLDGRRVLLTGGSRGLGKAMAAALAEAGADLILVGRDHDSLQAARQDLQRFGHEVELLTGDIGTPGAAQKMCEAALARFAAIDVLINNVGGRHLSIPTEDLPLDDWQRILDINLTSAFVCCKLIGKHMLERKRGVIINVASIAGLIVSKGIHGRTYETAKAALVAFSKTLAADWAPFNVRVNVIAPGAFLTDPNRRWFGEQPELKENFVDMTPMHRVGEPEEVGPLALFLASDASSYMTGAVLVMDGGYTLW